MHWSMQGDGRPQARLPHGPSRNREWLGRVLYSVLAAEAQAGRAPWEEVRPEIQRACANAAQAVAGAVGGTEAALREAARRMINACGRYANHARDCGACGGHGRDCPEGARLSRAIERAYGGMVLALRIPPSEWAWRFERALDRLRRVEPAASTEADIRAWRDTTR